MKYILLSFVLIGIGCTPINNDNPSKISSESRVTEQLKLSDGTCADVVTTFACVRGYCDRTATAIKVECKKQ